MSVEGRLVRRAMTRAPTIVSQGPAMMRPAMTTRIPERYRAQLADRGVGMPEHDEGGELDDPREQRDQPVGPRRARGNASAHTERRDLHSP